MTAHSGRCLCGGVTFSLTEQPVGTRACWCRDCQYLCSGNASLSVFFRQRALTISGTTADYVSASDAGNLIRRRFCPACGTPLFSDALAEPEYLVVRLGALDNRDIGSPQSTIWTDSAPEWAWFDHDKPHFPQQPS
ncbi:GFA family protein [Lacibacterium aquatile]|uniref:GFA family protein n=1 Tax=Lacibacterium aquatile TaxID=1168082 RepID=A0ABW5DLZ3_9PROT